MKVHLVIDKFDYRALCGRCVTTDATLDKTIILSRVTCRACKRAWNAWQRRSGEVQNDPI